MIREAWKKYVLGEDPQAKQIFDIFQSLGATKKELEASIPLPTKRATYFNLIHQPGPEKDILTWSFDDVLLDKLRNKGWITSTVFEGGPGGVLRDLVTALLPERASDINSVNIILGDFKRKGTDGQIAAHWLKKNLDTLKEVAEEIKSFKQADLLSQHMMTFPAGQRVEPTPQQMKSVLRHVTPRM